MVRILNYTFCIISVSVAGTGVGQAILACLHGGSFWDIYWPVIGAIWLLERGIGFWPES